MIVLMGGVGDPFPLRAGVDDNRYARPNLGAVQRGEGGQTYPHPIAMPIRT
jgi:hypothetical protein